MVVSFMLHAGGFALVEHVPQTLAAQLIQDGLQPVPVKHALAQLFV